MSTPRAIVIRPWPKMVFSWPTFLAALAAGWGTVQYPGQAHYIAILFLAVTFVNLMVLAFEFGRAMSLILLFAAVAGAAGFYILNERFVVFEPLKAWITNREAMASPEFYYLLAAIYGAVFVGMFVVTRLDYWILSSNELVHRKGILGDRERFSTAGLRLNREITDVFEFLFCGAGRIVLTIPGVPRAVVLDNVIGVRKIERRADELLTARLVRVAKETDAMPVESELG